MSSVRVRHPAPSVRTAVRILVVTNAYPAPERPSYGIYVARLVAALERAGHESCSRPRASRGGGWRTLRKYARLAWQRPLRPRARAGPTSSGGTTSCPRARSPAGPRARPACPYALTAHGTDVANAERSPRIRKATRRAVADACAVFAVSDDLGDRLDAIAGPLGERLHVVSAGVDLDAFVDGDREVALGALGWESDGPRVAYVGNLVPAKNLEPPAGGLRRRAPGLGRRSLALVGDGPRAREARAPRRRISASPEACASPASVPPATCRAGCAPATSPAWSRCARASASRRSRRWPAAAGRRVARGARRAPRSTEGVTGELCDAGTSRTSPPRSCGRGAEPRRGARAAAEPYAAGARGGARRRRARALP